MDTLILADSLTGAASAGVKFSANAPVKLTSLSNPRLPSNCDILALNAETRKQPPQEIGRSLRKLPAFLGSWRPQLVFQKIDSRLRGHVGLELAHLLAALSFRCALVVPASPEFGRATLNGIHMIGGKPLESAEASQEEPVHESRLKVLLAKDHDLPVESLEIATVRKGPAATAEAVEEFMSRHDRFLVACDAETEDDLDILVRSADQKTDQILFAGSSALATALTEFFRAAHNWLADEYHPPIPACPDLFFGGSPAETLRTQFELLAADHHGDLITINLEALFGGPGQTIPPHVKGRPLILTLPPPSQDPAEKAKYPIQPMISKFGRFAADLIKNRQHQSVFLSGGLTCREALESLGRYDTWIRSEICPGVVYLSAGPLSVLCKSGNFGAADLLSRLYKSLKEQSPVVYC
ncbi:MAG: hypothetical protein LBJ64_10380 [Deltaproteobacteria bacterium]|jgi:uncharacterized protein YgbK (DUF1537 family)|nr:hypothetical protein [Deltaproteobacteria bacterium]